MNIITNNNGLDYYLIGTENDYSLLKGCSHNQFQFVVAWKLHETEPNIYEWEQGHYFDNIGSACSCFDRKIMPFDPPYMVLA